MLPEKVDNFQSLSRVLVRDVGHASRLRHPFWQFIRISECATASHIHSGLSWSSTGTPAAEEVVRQDHHPLIYHQLSSQSSTARADYECKTSSACSSMLECACFKHMITWKRNLPQTKAYLEVNKCQPATGLYLYLFLYAFYDTPL